MKLSFKKVVGVILAVLMIASSMSAFACADDKFIAYDLIPDAYGKYAKIYKCPEEGIVKDGVAKTEEWVPAFYESEYPHYRVDTLVLDGNETGMIKYAEEWDAETKEYKNICADVDTKEVPEFWEVKAPYYVYNRVYSDFTGKYEPTTVLKTDLVKAPVKEEWVNKGFDKYVVEGNEVYDYTYAYAEFNNDNSASEIKSLANAYYDAVIAGFDADGNAIYTDAFMKGEAEEAYEIFEDAINNVAWKQLTGPDYVAGGTRVVVPFEDIVNGKPAAWYDEDLVTDIPDTIDFYGVEYDDAKAEIGWETIGYELKAPYRYYQALTVNGVEMDYSIVDLVGSTVEKEEVIDVFEDMPDKIKVIEQATALAGYESDSRIDWVITPFDIDAARKYSEKLSLKVLDNPLLEKELEDYTVPTDDATREVRFVKVSYEEGKSRLPYIWRYTGECANPEVEWKVAFAEAAKPYEIYEEKWVTAMNGVSYPTGEYRTTGRYADDVPTVSGGMGQPKVLTVMLEDETDRDALRWALEDTGYDYIIAGDRVNVIVPFEICEGTDDYLADFAAAIVDVVPSICEQFEIEYID